MKKVIVACGSGVATSQMIADKVNRLLKERNVEAEVLAIDIKSLPEHIESSDAYIAIIQAGKEYSIPTVNGVAFLTGVGQKGELEKLIQILEK